MDRVHMHKRNKYREVKRIKQISKSHLAEPLDQGKKLCMASIEFEVRVYRDPLYLNACIVSRRE